MAIESLYERMLKDLIFFLLEKLHQKLNKISNEAISKVELVSTACVFEVKSNPVVPVVLVVVCGNEAKSNVGVVSTE